MKAVSLFASGGIADLALEENGIDVIVANEFLPERASVYSHNFPKTKMIVGDIWLRKDEIIRTTKRNLKGKRLDFILATPPCQGMSKNGQGKLLRGIRAGMKPKIDIRNRLIIPTLQIIKSLKPTTIIFENVPEMENTIIDDENGNYVNIIEYIQKSLGREYAGKAEIVEFADYGIPQRRKRLITIFSRAPRVKEYLKINRTILPPRTHSHQKKGMKNWVTVQDTIAHLPKLDAKDKKSATSTMPYHYVPVLDPKKYVWISHTPPERGAFDNQCINPKCRYNKNPVHGASRDKNGVNRANGHTPLRCIKCGHLLPRPYTVEKDGTKRIMSGYTSAYKRMKWDLPASTLTTNMSYPSSDHKIHPDQNRVLSLLEVFKLHTLEQYNYKWVLKNGGPAKDALIREVIGESIPPKGISTIITHLLQISKEHHSPIVSGQLRLTY